MVGLAKNTGKTVTLSRIIEDATAAGLRLLLASFGRDGEYRDAIGEHRKPAIAVPLGACYATIEAFAGPAEARELIGATGLTTPIGEVMLFRSASERVRVELCGLNRVESLRRLKADDRIDYDLFLIDGALDRRASAVPDLADGVIIATGAAATDVAVVDADGVAAVTADAVARFTLPVHTGEITASPPVGFPAAGFLTGEIDSLLPRFAELRETDAYLLPGALTDATAERLLGLPEDARFALVVEDPTRVFLASLTQRRLARRGIVLRVRRAIPVLAVTVNPWRPDRPALDSEALITAVRQILPSGIPVVDAMRDIAG